MSRPLRVFLSAGEPSGDRLGAGLARALRELDPQVELHGMGGDEMAQAGVRLVQHARALSVVGLVEVLAHLPAIAGAMRRLAREIAALRPDVLVPIDFPDFNLRLAARARRLGVKVVYFVSPQVWAWRRGRVRTIRSLVHHMLVLFPFEERFYRDAGVPVTFVGHPAVERAVEGPPPRELRARMGLDPDRRTVALLPGSRRGEVARLLPPMLGAGARLRRDRPDLQFALPLARSLSREDVVARIRAAELHEVSVLPAEAYADLLRAADVGIVASGTATLEAALAGLPMVVVYRVAAGTYLLGRALVRVDAIALPNLVAGRRVVPELVQGACTPERIAAEAGALLDDPGRAAAQRRELAEIRRRLGGEGAFRRAAQVVREVARSV